MMLPYILTCKRRVTYRIIPKQGSRSLHRSMLCSLTKIQLFGIHIIYIYTGIDSNVPQRSASPPSTCRVHIPCRVTRTPTPPSPKRQSLPDNNHAHQEQKSRRARQRTNAQSIGGAAAWSRARPSTACSVGGAQLDKHRGSNVFATAYMCVDVYFAERPRHIGCPAHPAARGHGVLPWQ